MSLSTPTTSMPSAAKCRTDSEPIRPAEPVTTTTLLIKTSADNRNGPRLQGVRGPPGRRAVGMHGANAKWARHLFGTRDGEGMAQPSEDEGGLHDGVSPHGSGHRCAKSR